MLSACCVACGGKLQQHICSRRSSRLIKYAHAAAWQLSSASARCAVNNLHLLCRRSCRRSSGNTCQAGCRAPSCGNTTLLCWPSTCRMVRCAGSQPKTLAQGSTVGAVAPALRFSGMPGRLQLEQQAVAAGSSRASAA
jgi:hypothetical protein